MIGRARALMAQVERVLRAFGVACLLAVAVLVFVDVGARYLLHAPLTWSFELISMYLMPAMFYFAVSDTLAAGHHIAVDLFRRAMPDWLVRITEIFGCAAMAAVFAVVVWYTGVSGIEKLRSGAVVMGVIEWPSWIPDAIAACGSFVIVLRLASRSVGHALSLLSGRPVIELPTVVGDY